MERLSSIFLCPDTGIIGLALTIKSRKKKYIYFTHIMLDNFNYPKFQAKTGIGDFVWLEGSEDLPPFFSMQELKLYSPQTPP